MTIAARTSAAPARQAGKPRLLPVFLEDYQTEPFRRQLEALKVLSGDFVEWLEPAQVAEAPRISASAVVVPDMSGLAYRLLREFQAIDLPIMIITSEFGTVSMWDWEIRDFLRRRDVDTIAPTSLEEFHDLCRAVGVKERLSSATMLAYQDNLGAGKQPDIFKRFYWWEDECVSDLQESFGVSIERRSYKELWSRALSMPTQRLEDEMARVLPNVPISGLVRKAREDAIRLKLALDDELDETPGVIAAGINCLNESETSTTTPCLAWNLLFEERGLIWGCEADLTSMITQYLTWETLRTPAIMTNLYPFLMGNAALKHEKIPFFPAVDKPENHILVAHCGFLGQIPQSWATEWTLRPPVLEIVDPNAHVIDGRLPEGQMTIVKIASTMDRLVVTPAELTTYQQYANSDCLNGAVLRIEDGYRYAEGLPSHHAVIAVSDIVRRLEVVGPVLGVGIEKI
jgi:hypothetical protein